MKRSSVAFNVVLLLILTTLTTIVFHTGEVDGYIIQRITSYEVDGRKPAVDSMYMVYEGETNRG